MKLRRQSKEAPGKGQMDEGIDSRSEVVSVDRDESRVPSICSCANRITPHAFDHGFILSGFAEKDDQEGMNCWKPFVNPALMFYFVFACVAWGSWNYKYAIKRKVVGIWSCKYCGKVKAGGA
ncbi:hypothetical protein CISIN_1g037395mg [Citrus sinensis]|uniref:Uncharacterized protein n=1 Tax=Citrus sinensis TaxID=2711 RepID=A0A067DHZ4_CITSI|nr:hypothetical protein CISIN_1g037395mg [Citrus sinensis]